jgi:integrase
MPGAGERLEPCATREEAIALLEAARYALQEGDVVPVGGHTLRGFGNDWLDERERSGIRGIRTDRSRWKVHVARAHFADWPLGSISRADVREWLDVLLKKRAKPGHGHKSRPTTKLGRTTIQSTINLLRVCFESAVEKEMITTNPAAGVKLPRSQGATHDPWTYLEPDEQTALATCEAIPPADRRLILFALWTGMRQGEVWNLQIRDVDLEAGRLVVRYGSKGKATKSGKIRRLPLFGLALEAAREQLAALKGTPNPHGLLWPLPSGARREKGKAPRGWRRALELAGIVPEARHDGRAVRWHDLRHTCASSLVAGWWGRRWSLEEVRQLLGHSSVTVTERYAHLADSALDSAARETDLSSVYPGLDPAALDTGSVSAAPPARIGLATFGLGKRSFPEMLRGVGSNLGPSLDRSARARAALEALASGTPEAWRLAVDVLVDVAGEQASPALPRQHRRAAG